MKRKKNGHSSESTEPETSETTDHGDIRPIEDDYPPGPSEAEPTSEAELDPADMTGEQLKEAWGKALRSEREFAALAEEQKRIRLGYADILGARLAAKGRGAVIEVDGQKFRAAKDKKSGKYELIAAPRAEVVTL